LLGHQGEEEHPTRTVGPAGVRHRAPWPSQMGPRWPSQMGPRWPSRSVRPADATR
jgi:hypothetical protein